MELEPGQLVADRYRVESLLGEGGFGAVYAARHLEMDRVVALKVLHRSLSGDDRAQERFYREMRAASRIEHPNTVQVYDFGRTDDGAFFLTMEFVKGRTLFDELRDSGPLAEPRIVHIGGQIAQALAAAHSEGIVHRDLKPENILLVDKYGQRDWVKVLDFGIARLIERDFGEEVEQITNTGQPMGTPAYMSPEQCQGIAVDYRSDLYSLGVILFRMATGRAPFQATTPLALLVMHVQDAPPAPSEIHGSVAPWLEHLVMELLAKDPDDRPGSAQEVFDCLQSSGTDAATAATLQPDATPAGMDQPVVNEAAQMATLPAGAQATAPAPTRKSKTGLAVAAGVLVLAGAGLALGLGLGGGEPEAPPPKSTRVEVDTPTVAEVGPAAVEDVAAPIAQPDVPVATPDAGRAPDVPPPAPKLEAPEGMVAIPAGRYPIGCQDGDTGCFDDEKPGRLAELGPFAIMRREVTMEEYDLCVGEGKCPKARKKKGCNWQRPGRDAHPINCVDWAGASAWCAWRGWQLPTEAQWEAAARGAEHPDQPWGDEAPDCTRTSMAVEGQPGCGTRSTHPVEAHPRDKSWAGALDMAGNVSEWVRDDYAAYPGGQADPATSGKGHRGGHFRMTAKEFATTHTRFAAPADARRPEIGFRCVKELASGR